MGEYLQLLTSVKGSIYQEDYETAVKLLRKLLNSLNAEYTSMVVEAEKAKRKKAIEKLLPVLKDLNKGNLSYATIKTLKLDSSRLKMTQEDILEEVFKKPVDTDESIFIEEPKEEVKPEKKKVIKKPSNIFAPLYLDDYIGQEKAKMSLRISIAAAKQEDRVLNHLLICSSYGLGKTTLANIIANEMGLPFFNCNAMNLKDVRSVSNYFSKIEESSIIFIDEIHSLKNDVQTLLLSILTDFEVNFINENGEEIKHHLPPFTLIGATTQAGELLKPFLNRFQILELVDYTEEEKETIVREKFAKIGYQITDECVLDISKRSRGIPRTIEIFAKGIRDIALTKNTKLINKEITDLYFTMYDIDESGLNKNDLLVLKVLSEATRPLALITIESKTGIQKEDLEYRYEPFLIKLGLMEKTEKGRVITEAGLAYLNLPTAKDDSNGTD